MKAKPNIKTVYTKNFQNRKKNWKKDWVIQSMASAGLEVGLKRRWLKLPNPSDINILPFRVNGKKPQTNIIMR